jgi:hypothetical protein
MNEIFCQFTNQIAWMWSLVIFMILYNMIVAALYSNFYASWDRIIF